MKKYSSSTYLILVIILLIPLLIFASVHILQEKYEPLHKFTNATNITNIDYHFQNQNNINKSFINWKNKILVVDFFFTACPSICPKMTNGLKEIAKYYMNDSNIHLLSFTVDPLHDTTKKLLDYLIKMKAYSSNWDFLTGDKKLIYKLARKEFFVTATDGDGGVQDFIHSDKIILVDQHNYIRGYYDGTNPKEIQLLIKDINKLEHEV